MEWEDEKNLGYFAKGSPVLIQFVVKQKTQDEDVVLGAGSLRSEDFMKVEAPA